MASDSGVMYSSAVTLAAIWCAAVAVVPSRATNSAISVNEVISTSTVSAAGSPRRAKAASVGACGRSSRCHRPSGANRAWVRSSHSARASST